MISRITGTKVGPVVTPWGSLATLIWFESCRRRCVRNPVRTFALTRAGLPALTAPDSRPSLRRIRGPRCAGFAALAVPAAVSALLLTR